MKNIYTFHLPGLLLKLISHSEWFSKVKGGRSPGQTMLLPQAHLPSTMLQPVFSLAEAPHSTSLFTGGPATRANRIRMSPTVQIEIGRGNALQWQASSSARVQGNWARSGLVSALGVCSKEKLQFPASLFLCARPAPDIKKGPETKDGAVKSTRRRRVMKIFSLASLERLRVEKNETFLFSLYIPAPESKNVGADDESHWEFALFLITRRQSGCQQSSL